MKTQEIKQRRESVLINNMNNLFLTIIKTWKKAIGVIDFY